MSKSVLLIDTPEDCIQCPLLTGSDECMMQDDDANFDAGTLDELIQTEWMFLQKTKLKRN